MGIWDEVSWLQYALDRWPDSTVVACILKTTIQNMWKFTGDLQIVITRLNVYEYSKVFSVENHITTVSVVHFLWLRFLEKVQISKKCRDIYLDAGTVETSSCFVRSSASDTKQFIINASKEKSSKIYLLVSTKQIVLWNVVSGLSSKPCSELIYRAVPRYWSFKSVSNYSWYKLHWKPACYKSFYFYLEHSTQLLLLSSPEKLL